MKNELIHDEMKLKILDHAPVHIAFHDERQGRIWKNKAFQDDPIQPGSAAGKELPALVREMGETMLPVRKAFQTGIPCRAEMTVACLHPLPSDQASLLIQAVPIKDEKEKTLGVVETIQDVTVYKQAERRQALTASILGILNEPIAWKEAISRIIAAIKAESAAEAVGVRLREGDDFPYSAHDGFSEDFLLQENSLINPTLDSMVCAEADTSPLECTCGLVLSGRIEPEGSCFTPGGSFWTNDLSSLPEIPAHGGRRVKPRNRCLKEGFRSMVLVPIQVGGEVIGLLQLCDRRAGMLNRERIQFVEEISASVGLALQRRNMDAAKEKMELMNRQLQKSESLDRMAGAIAHHYNNQLQVVIGSLEMAMDDLDQTDKGAPGFLRDAIKAATRISEVSCSLVTYLGKTHETLEYLDLVESCRRTLSIFKAALPKNLAAEVFFPNPGPVVHANAVQIQQVMTNLLINAWEAYQNSHGVLRISISTAAPGAISESRRFPGNWQPTYDSYACLEVRDEGCGIPEKEMENLFDPFFSLKSPGRGMGLAVVLGIVRSYKGCITVMSQPDQGSTFRVYLPVAVREATASMEKKHGSNDVGRSGTVLLVEDEPRVREVASGMLNQLGFTVISSRDGVEAIELFLRHQDLIRLVLCDLTMPRMNGWETLAALRELAPEIPVILSSGYSKLQMMEGIDHEEPHAYLSKPYRREQLWEAICLALQGCNGGNRTAH